MDEKPPVSLPEEDYLKVIDIIRRLQACRDKSDLRNCLQQHLMPLIQVPTCGYAWADVSVAWKGMVKPAQTIDLIGIPPSKWPTIDKLHSYLTSLFKIAFETNRSVIAFDVDIPREEFQKDIKRFADDHPDLQTTGFYGVFDFSDFKTSLTVMDRENHIVAGFQRYSPNDKPFTLREIRLMELLRPGLFHVVKRVAIQEQLQTYRKLTEALAENEVPCALVREDGRVLFRNPAFHAMASVEPGNILPKELKDVFEQQVDLLNPDRRPESSAPPLAFYNSPDAVYRLSVTQLHPSGNEEAESAWLVRLHPADDPYTLMNLNLQKAGLTPREVEVAILIGDGLEDSDIAQRLFIAPNTLKNHLKSIYKKLDVHSRTQLAAPLRPSTEEGGRRT